MNEIAGLVCFDRQPIDQAATARLTRAVLSSGAPFTWRPDPHVLLVEGRRDGAGASPPMQYHPHRTMVINAWLEAPDEVALALGGVAASDHRRLAAQACAEWGVEAAVERLAGNVSVAAWDREGQRLILARDAFGNVPLYYVTGPDFALFASSIQILFAMPQVSRELDLTIVGDTMTRALQNQEDTIYRQIRRAPPGGFVILGQGSVRTERYYTLDRIVPVRLKHDADYVEAGRALLDQAVACRLPAEGRIGSELSGGFDSAGVTATAARLLGEKRLTAFTRVAGATHPEGPLDERGLAGKLVARYATIDWTIVDDDRAAPRDTDPRSEMPATLLPRTSSFNSTWFEALAYAVERSGVSTLLTGATGNTTLSHWGRAPIAEDVRAGNWGKAWRDFRASTAGSSARERAAFLFRAAAPRSLKRWRAGPAPWSGFSLVSRDFLDEIDYASHARAVGHDVPFDLPYDSGETRLRMLQAQRARDFAGFVNRRNWSYAVRDPYIDRRLVEFCLGIPGDQYWRDGQDRWLARRVLADRVPAETLEQRVLGRQSPEWYALATRRRAEMAELVERIALSPLASRILDIPRMRALLADWPADAVSAQKSVNLHGHALQRALAMGGFLCWHEGRND